jgi:hypothetical protein
MSDEQDIYAGKPGDSYGTRYLPGLGETLAEVRAALDELCGPDEQRGPSGHGT